MNVADVRAIIAKGWSSRGGDPAKEGGNIEFPDSCFGLEKVPHGWLFPRGTCTFAPVVEYC
jgi:sterol 3beta-glucosyltransferase